MTTLETKTKQEIDALTSEETSRKNSYAYEHELLWYGLDGLAHYWLMKKAKDFIEQGKSPQEFQTAYGIKPGNEIKRSLSWRYQGTFYYPLSKIAQDGIYIPSHALEKQVILFDKTDVPQNRKFEENTGTLDLCYRKWNIEDFANMDLVKNAMIFGKELWNSGARGFNNYKNGSGNIIIKQSDKVTSLGERLIDYYSRIIEGEK